MLPRRRFKPDGLGLSIVVPRKMLAGNSRLRTSSFQTRPCSSSGNKTPGWLQDHIAYGDTRSMQFFLRGASRFQLRADVSHMFNPEKILARFVKSAYIRVHCDDNVKYTIVR